MRIFKINKDTKAYKTKIQWIDSINARNEIFIKFIDKNFPNETGKNKIFPSTDYEVLFFKKDVAENFGKSKFYKKIYQHPNGEFLVLKSSTKLHKKYLQLIKDHKDYFTTPKFCFINYDLPYDAPCSTSYNPVNKNLYLLIDSQIFKAGYELLRDSVEVAEEEYNKDMNI